MCQSAITLIQNSLPKVDSDELLLKIKGRIALFMLTMEVSWKPPSPSNANQPHRNGAIQYLP
jgi:hypothetical protein